jgi:hypothetical protein
MPPAPPTRRRWFQFSIRDLLWLMAVIACLLFARKNDLGWSNYAERLRESADANLNKRREEMVEQVHNALKETTKWKSLYEACRAERERERESR